MLVYLIALGSFQSRRTPDFGFPAIESVAIRMDPTFTMLLRCSVHPPLLKKQESPRCSFFAIESHSMMTLSRGPGATRSVPSVEQKLWTHVELEFLVFSQS